MSSYNQQIFTIAHEGLHIAFEHVTRQDNKQIKEKKHRKLWNIATDAVINPTKNFRIDRTIFGSITTMLEILPYFALISGVHFSSVETIVENSAIYLYLH